MRYTGNLSKRLTPPLLSGSWERFRPKPYPTPAATLSAGQAVIENESIIVMIIIIKQRPAVSLHTAIP